MGFAETTLQVVLAYGSLLVIVWAFIDAARHPRADYTIANRMPRWAWLTALGFAFAMLVWLGAWRPDEPFGPRSIMWLASMFLVGVYAFDMRPRLRQAQADRLG